MKRKTVSLCIIARDEEATIGQTIKSALAIVDEIVVGDTGSEDNTRLIAEGYGAKVLDVPWRDDFAAARNAVIEAASSDWILVLDADERLQPVRPVELQRLLTDERAAGYRFCVSEGEGGSLQQQVRLFRNHPYVRYCYPVHDTVEIALENWAASRDMQVLPSRLSIRHDPGDAARVSARQDRNRRLLRDAWHEYPYEPYFAYRLLTESMPVLEDEVLPASGLTKHVEQLGKAWSIIEGMAPAQVKELSYGPELAGLASASWIAAGDTQRALDTVRSALEIFPGEPSLLFRRAVAIVRHLEGAAPLSLTESRAASLRTLAENDLRDCLASAPGHARDDRWRWLWPLRYQGELALLAGDLPSARERFLAALDQDPEYSHAWSGRAACAAAAGEHRRALGYYLRAVTLDERNVTAWLRGSAILEMLGFTDNAKSWRRRARDLFPEARAFDGELSWRDEWNPSVLAPTT